MNINVLFRCVLHVQMHVCMQYVCTVGAVWVVSNVHICEFLPCDISMCFCGLFNFAAVLYNKRCLELFYLVLQMSVISMKCRVRVWCSWGRDT